MVIQFNSFRKALIVLLVIPIAVSGVFVIFALFGIPLSFPALIGVQAGILQTVGIARLAEASDTLHASIFLTIAPSSGAALLLPGGLCPRDREQQ